VEVPAAARLVAVAAAYRRAIPSSGTQHALFRRLVSVASVSAALVVSAWVLGVALVSVSASGAVLVSVSGGEWVLGAA
jgi:hypothetical protein